MYYHVRVMTKWGTSRGEIKLDLSKEQLFSQFIRPYENYKPIVVNGKTITPKNLDRISISITEDDSTKILSILETEMKAEGRRMHGVSLQWSVTSKGEDITDQLIRGPPGYKKQKIMKKVEDVKPKSNQIFIVHGHDNEMKATVALTLKNIGLEPIILHEQANRGKTIIEKFETCSENVSFAVVLLSPDDRGYKKDQEPESASYRARQNVILELGYFLGKLGRENVCALLKTEENFEFPSDIFGSLYTPYNSNSGWKLALAKELKVAGYDIDFGKL